MPASSDSDTDLYSTSFPSKVTVPSSLEYIPVKIFIRVDFPAPFSPISATTSPLLSSSSAFFNAATPEKDFFIFFIVSNADIKSPPYLFSLLTL